MLVPHTRGRARTAALAILAVAACAAALCSSAAAARGSHAGLTGPGGALRGCVSRGGALKVVPYAKRCPRGSQTVAIGAPTPTTPASSTQVTQLQSTVAALQGQVSSLQASNATLHTELTTLDGGNDHLLSGVSRNATTLLLSGMNLQLESGAGATTATPNGLGNLIVGYDESPGAQTGSANIVMGDHNAFTSYGSIVGGENNDAGAPFASVISGQYNQALDPFSLLAAGCDNVTGTATTAPRGSCGAAGLETILGGVDNSATGEASSIVSGEYNVSSDTAAVVAGGCSNVAGSGTPSLVCGADAEAILGGFGNQATGLMTATAGGADNIAGGQEAGVFGGTENVASSTWDVVTGGDSNNAGGEVSTIAGGALNSVTGGGDLIAGGNSETLGPATHDDTKVAGSAAVGP